MGLPEIKGSFRPMNDKVLEFCKHRELQVRKTNMWVLAILFILYAMTGCLGSSV